MKTIPLALLILVFAVLSVDVHGQEAPKDEKPKDGKEIAVAYVLGEPDRLMKQLPQEVSELSAMQKGALDWKGYGESEFKDGAYHFPNEGAKAKQVDAQRGRLTDLEKRLEGLKTGECPIPILTIASKGLLELGHFPIIEEGKAGILSYPEFTCKAPFGTDSDPRQISARVFQVIDESQMLMELHGAPGGAIRVDAEFKQTFLVKMSTAGCVDDQSFTLKGLFVVSGRHQYKTVAGGSKTVFVLERIDPEWLKAEVKKRMPPSTINRVVEFVEKEKAQRTKEEVDRKAAEDKVRTERARAEAAAAKAAEAMRAAKEKEEAEKKAAEEKAEADRKAAIEEAKWRTWTDSTGQFTTKAMFGGMAGGKVKLIKKDGSTVRLPLNTLSQEDQDWLNKKFRRKAVPVVATEKPDAEESHVAPEKPTPP